MKKLFSFFLVFLLIISFGGITQAATNNLAADAHCDSAWFYQFNFNNQSTKIEHCGRNDDGTLNYTFTNDRAGKLSVYYKTDIDTNLKLKINDQQYTKKIKGHDVWRTDLSVKVGDKIALLADMGDTPYSGWISPDGNVCNGFAGAGDLIVTSLYNKISADQLKLISAQCWGDGYAHEKLLKEKLEKPIVKINCTGSDKDCHDTLIEDMDFNDGAFFLAVDERLDHQSSCDALNILSGNNSKIPAKVTFEIKASDNLGAIKQYRLIFGDGKQSEGNNPVVEHTYESSGKFNVLAQVKDSQNQWISSDQCEVTATIKSSDLESHRSDCSYLTIVSGQNQTAPALVKFKVAGFDNKGDIQRYKIDFGDEQRVEAGRGSFEHLYEKPGTYKIKAQVKDSKDNWLSSDDCQQTLYVSTQPITKQPSTGTPTWMSVGGLLGGALALFYPFAQSTKKMNLSFKKVAHPKRKK